MLSVLSPQPLWRYIYKDIFGEDDFNITVIGTLVWSTALFWTLSLSLMYTDLTGRPRWMSQYKVQPGTNQPVDKTKLWRAIKQVLYNDVVVGVPYLVFLYPLQKYTGCSPRPDQLPSILKVLVDAIGPVAFDEIWFYYTHRLFHWGPLYRAVHKRHHEWTAPVGVVASYCHPLEHAVCNLTPLYMGSVLLSSHLLSFWVWILVFQLHTVLHHSGYKLPYLPDPDFHDYHHLKFNGNYGGGFLDKLHGTYIGIGKSSKHDTRSVNRS